jgi:hypothetical protein
MRPSHSLRSGKEVIFQTDTLEVRRTLHDGQHQLHSRRPIKKGDVVCSFLAAQTLSEPTYLTVQTGKNEHITLDPDCLQYLNHSCDPNVFLDTDEKKLVCLRDVGAGEELTFFYPSTEWEMAQPFVCLCGSSRCLKLIQGASFLSSEVLRQYALTKFIVQRLIEQENVVTP